ncbi:site-specific integrase [Hyphomicrobium sp.]|uniref:site-specific integrase n=1 Tax=Hyphomicrobium sp. TaxID=82 RepID=UPI000FA42138|nr:site-specific integrase [Hyphomicrobium sp.]RUP07747.1 MAG: site-specific integrase [Hyphomicrobium sp.]
MTDHNVFDGHALPVSAWPEADRRAWIEAQLEDDNLLAEPKPAAHLRPSSRELYSRCYGIWLAWLKSEGFLDEGARPEERVTKARLTAYLQAERALGNGARTLVNHAVCLDRMFEVLAPLEDWSWTMPMIYKLKSAVKSVKNHSDLPSIRELFEVGLAVMQKASQPDHGSPKQHAIWFRNGLAIALLAARSLMRRNNLAMIKIDYNLIKEGAGYVLRFSGDEMKGRTRRGGPVPTALTPFIDRFIEIYRPRLLLGKSDEHNMLFISGMGNPITPHNLSDEIGKITFAVFGRRVTAHEFRHATGSSMAKEDPDHVGLVPTILGHAHYRTSESYYIVADEMAAFNRYDKALDRLMRDDISDQKLEGSRI